VQIILSSSSGVPMYEQIKDRIRSAIHSGELKSGDHLPSLRHLAADLRVSVMTTTRAYNDLVAEGLANNEHGRAFVVREIDPEVARVALEQRQLEAIRELVECAIAAHTSPAEIHELIDNEWNNNEQQRDQYSRAEP
jgi:GntR family transcriptional regulator